MVPELLTTANMADLLNVSKAQFRRWNDAGLVPAPFQLVKDGILLWRRREIVDWIDAGLPDRDAWRRMGWRPSVSMKLAAYIELQKQEAVDATNRAKEALALLKEGMDMIKVYRPGQA